MIEDTHGRHFIRHCREAAKSTPAPRSGRQVIVGKRPPAGCINFGLHRALAGRIEPKARPRNHYLQERPGADRGRAIGIRAARLTGAIFPILLNTIHGVESIDRRLVNSARSLGAGRAAILREVIVPGALPSIVTGLSIGMGTSWFCLITAEMISGQFGIGYYTWEAFTLQNYADIVLGMLLIGILGMSSSVLVNALGRLAMPWHIVKRTS
jgi:hypothetical protein